VSDWAPPYRGPYMKPRLTSLAATNEAVANKTVVGVFENFGREVVLVDGDLSLECVAGRLVLRTAEQTQHMIDMRAQQLSEHAAELNTFNNIGGGPKGRRLSTFHDIVEGDIQDTQYVRPPLAVRRGLKVIDDFTIEEGVD
jgi:hypothetical protein